MLKKSSVLLLRLHVKEFNGLMFQSAIKKCYNKYSSLWAETNYQIRIIRRTSITVLTSARQLIITLSIQFAAHFAFYERLYFSNPLVQSTEIKRYDA
jgi:hypothetical protein